MCRQKEGKNRKKIRSKYLTSSVLVQQWVHTVCTTVWTSLHENEKCLKRCSSSQNTKTLLILRWYQLRYFTSMPMILRPSCTSVGSPPSGGQHLEKTSLLTWCATVATDTTRWTNPHLHRYNYRSSKTFCVIYFSRLPPPLFRPLSRSCTSRLRNTKNWWKCMPGNL